MNVSFAKEEFSIRKANFVISENKKIALEFDKKIKIRELKKLVRKAGLINKDAKFKLICDDYDCSSDQATFEEIFKDKNDIIFKLEFEEVKETETMPKKNPCSIHEKQELLYYCRECSKSICVKCLIEGNHKSHDFFEKSLLLYSSATLADSILSNIKYNPFEDLKLTNKIEVYYKENVCLFFNGLMSKIKELQDNINKIIRTFIEKGEESNNNLKNIMKQVRVEIINEIEKNKNLINVKSILNEERTFKNFYEKYEDISNSYISYIKNKLETFKYFDKGISSNIQNRINVFMNIIDKNISLLLENFNFDDILNDINENFIGYFNKEEIVLNINESLSKSLNSIGGDISFNKTIKRNTLFEPKYDPNKLISGFKVNSYENKNSDNKIEFVQPSNMSFCPKSSIFNNNNINLNKNNKITINLSNSKDNGSKSFEKISFKESSNKNTDNNFTFADLSDSGVNFLENKNNSAKIEIEETEDNLKDDEDMDVEDATNQKNSNNKEVFETILEVPEENENNSDKKENN